MIQTPNRYTVGVDDLQASGGNLFRKLGKFIAAPGLDIIPPGGGVTVRIDYDAQGFES